MRKVIEAYLHREDGQPQLVLVFEDGEHVAQDINEDSYMGWADEGLVIIDK